MMSSFANPLLVSRREIPHEPTASTDDHGAPPQRHKRTDASILCLRSPPAGPVLPPLPRPHRRTGTAALLPPPHKRREPGPGVHAPLLQWHPLLLSARLAACLVPAGAPACANPPPAPRCPPCGGGQAPPHVRPPLAQPSLLHDRL